MSTLLFLNSLHTSLPTLLLAIFFICMVAFAVPHNLNAWSRLPYSPFLHHVYLGPVLVLEGQQWSHPHKKRSNVCCCCICQPSYI